MLPATLMRSLPNVPMPIASFIRLEVIELLSSTRRKRPMISIAWIVPVVHVPIEPMRPMEPRPSAKEYAADEPVGPIVPVRRTIVRSIVEVPIRANRRHAKINANRNLRRSHSGRRHRAHSYSRENNCFQPAHIVPFQITYNHTESDVAPIPPGCANTPPRTSKIQAGN